MGHHTEYSTADKTEFESLNWNDDSHLEMFIFVVISEEGVDMVVTPAGHA